MCMLIAHSTAFSTVYCPLIVINVSSLSQLEVARLLLERGADVNAPAFDDMTPFAAACLEGNAAVAQLLMERGAEVVFRRDEEPLLHLVCDHGDAHVAQLLLQRGANVHQLDSRSGCLLIC